MKDVIIMESFFIIDNIYILLFGIDNNFIIILIIIMVLDVLANIVILEHINLLEFTNKIKHELLKKLYILVIVILSHELDIIIGENMSIRNITICFFIANEGLDILDKAQNLSIPLPRALIKVLNLLKHKGDNIK